MTREMIAVIPARGGSKRIPHKNLVEFGGRPLIAWTIEAAVESDLFERVLVSTDDAEIATLAEEYGLDVPFLRDRGADDFTPVSEATIAALSQVRSHIGETYQTVVQLLPSCPLRESRHIIEAVDNFRQQQATFQISCSEFGWTNPWWAVTLDDNQAPQPLFPEQRQARSQDLPRLYCPTGAIWIAEVEKLYGAGTFYGPGHIYFPIEWSAGIDIDNPGDLELARALL
ncbi:MAG: acylneuraminate cytidylyltransferase family protein [candidate division Zixibacteria bacterium]|nr:acylneuraminate cytidylyltransferase family protein [candidate division Zixibacteria bacterium]